jgi:methionine aminopeptidase
VTIRSEAERVGMRRAGFHVIGEVGGHGVGRAVHEEPHVVNVEDPASEGQLDGGSCSRSSRS